MNRNGTVTIGNVKGRPVQVDWRFVDIRGKSELRIQDTYPVGQRIEEVVS